VKKQTVQVADLIQADKNIEKVKWRIKQIMTKCIVCVLAMYRTVVFGVPGKRNIYQEVKEFQKQE